MRNMNCQLSLMCARSDKSAIQAARVRGLAAGNRCHGLGSPAFRHRSMIHSHLSARSMRPSSLMPSRIESGAFRRGVSARRVSYAAGGFSRLRAARVRVPRRSNLSRRARITKSISDVSVSTQWSFSLCWRSLEIPRGKLNLGLVVARGHVGPGDTLPRWESESRGALKGHSGVARPTREPLKGAAMLGAWAASAILVAFVLSGLKVLREYQRAVVFRLGRVVGARGPGIVYVIPGIEKALRIDLRTITMNIPSQDVITKDNVSLKVNAVLYFRVIDSNRAVVEVENYLFATSQNAQTTLRSVCGEAELDQLLAEREKINAHLQTIIDQHTEPWGIKVVQVAIKFIDLDR